VAHLGGHVSRQLNYIRVISGTLTTGMAVQNTSTDTKETVSAMLYVIGKKQTPVAKALPGDIVAIPKMKNTKTGNTLTAVGQTTKLPAIDFPPPVMYAAVQAKTQADDDTLSTAIHRLLDADPTLHFEKQVETKQIILKGLGDVHIDVAVSLMKSQTNVSVDLSVPKVPYRETVTALGDGHYRHKKQSGGRGQFGEVYLRVFPRRPDETGDWFVDKTVGGSIPGNFMPAVHKGVVEGMLAGSVAGYPVQNIRVEIYDGSFHPVDSSEIAFKIAGSRALREGMAKAKPVLLEPVMRLKITIPETFMGAISGDIRTSAAVSSAWSPKTASGHHCGSAARRTLQVRGRAAFAHRRSRLLHDRLRPLRHRAIERGAEDHRRGHQEPQRRDGRIITVGVRRALTERQPHPMSAAPQEINPVERGQRAQARSDQRRSERSKRRRGTRRQANSSAVCRNAPDKAAKRRRT
jgi:hypothetical protein